MEKNLTTTCSSCGARMSRDAVQCALCGWIAGEQDNDAQPAQGAENTELTSVENSTESAPTSVAEKGPYCHMCGNENPAGAKFCSACGTKLLEVKSASKATADKPAAKPAAQPVHEVASADAKSTEAKSTEAKPAGTIPVGMLAIAGVLIVAALYMITVFSRNAFPDVEPAPAQAETSQGSQQSAEIAADIVDRVNTLEAEAEALSGNARLLKFREIVSIYSSINRPDKAAPVQEKIATESNTGDDWFNAGHFYYDWMDQLGGEERFSIAQQAVSAYEKGLEINPDDLNTRTALAMAYLNTRAPMQGVQQIRSVLDTDPNHLQGNFYYGVMLMQINRQEQAVAQFEKVKTLVSSDSPIYQQADRILQGLKGQ